MAQLNFDATKVEPSSPATGLPVSGPEGYPVVITNSEFKPVKDKENCGFLELMLSVIDGEHKGSSGAYRLNLYSDNEKAVNIAYRQLSAICHAVGVYQVADSAQLHNLPFRVVVELQKGDNPQGFTEVKLVLCADGSAPGKGKVAAQPQQAAAPAPQAAPVQPQAAPAGWGATPITPAPEATQAAPAWGTQQPQQAPASAPPWAAKP